MLTVSALVSLSCTDKSPVSSSDPARPVTAVRSADPAAGELGDGVIPGYENTVTLSVVRVTNTSGGAVLVGALPPGKPAIVHVDVIDYQTDLDGLREIGGMLPIHLSFDGMPVSFEPVYFTA